MYSIFSDRTLSYVKHGCLSRKLHSEEKKSFKHYQQMIKEDRDASLLRMFDAFIESVPQLIIQIYIALQHKAEESLYLGKKENTLINIILINLKTNF